MAEKRLAARELVARVGVGHVAFDILAPTRELVCEARLFLGERLERDAQRMARRPPLAVRRIVHGRIAARERGIDDEETPHFGAVVMAAADHRDLVAVAGTAARIVEERRHPGIGTPHGKLAHAVGIHRHQDARPVVGLVGIFPARVEDASVMRDGGRVVRILLVGELAHLAGLAVHAVDDRHRHVAVLARQELVRRRAEHDHLVLVGQIGRIPPLNVVFTVLG